MENLKYKRRRGPQAMIGKEAGTWAARSVIRQKTLFAVFRKKERIFKGCPTDIFDKKDILLQHRFLYRFFHSQNFARMTMARCVLTVGIRRVASRSFVAMVVQHQMLPAQTDMRGLMMVVSCQREHHHGPESYAETKFMK